LTRSVVFNVQAAIIQKGAVDLFQKPRAEPSASTKPLRMQGPMGSARGKIEYFTASFGAYSI